MMRTVRAAALVSAFVAGQAMALPTAHAADVCADFGGSIDQGGLCRVNATKPNYSLKMSFPVDSPNQAAVDDFLTQTRNGFLNETQTPNYAGAPYAMDVTASAVGIRHHAVRVVRDLRRLRRRASEHLVQGVQFRHGSQPPAGLRRPVRTRRQPDERHSPGRPEGAGGGDGDARTGSGQCRDGPVQLPELRDHAVGVGVLLRP